MYNKKKLPLRYLILIILIVIIIFLAIVYHVVNDERKLNPIEITLKDTGLFINQIVYAPIKFVNNKIKSAKEKNNIYIKYQELQQKVDKIDLLEAKNDELKKEIDSMKDILDLNSTLSKKSFLNATVVNRNIGLWYNTITIDKGKFNGVEVDMPVIVCQGLIGKVITTTNFNSTVKLLTNENRNNKISIKIKIGEKYVYGLLTGYNKDDNTFIIEGIDENIEIPIDSVVTTTGLGNFFPSGILVGKVYDIQTDNFDLAKIIKVKSKVNFDDLSFVTILKRGEE